MQFQVGIGGAVFKEIEELKKATETKHKELLELISTMSETNTTIDGSSVCEQSTSYIFNQYSTGPLECQ